MALELIAAIVAAVAFGGIAHLAAALLGYRPCRAGSCRRPAGLGLIGYTVWSEYDWFGRVSAELPPEVEVVGHARAAPSPCGPGPIWPR